MNENLPQWLAERLSRPLPGPMIGSRFEASPRPWHCYDVPPDARPAAVLLLLYPHEGEWHLPLMLRTPHLGIHASQVSLPGGAVEPGESTFEAALREFHEELGGDGVIVEPLGPLSPYYVRASNFIVAPWMAVAETRPRLTPNPREVDEVLEVPLSHLLAAANFGSHTRHHEGQTYNAPHFAFGQHRIWGATCMMLGELVTLLEEIA